MNRAVKLTASAILCAVTAAAAGQVLPGAIQACRSERDDARRLQCYDREAAKFPIASEQISGVTAPNVAAAQQPSPATAPAVKDLAAKVVAIRDRPHAGFVVTFDNGQVWMQNEMDSAQQIIAVGDAVTIRPGRRGSFWLVGPSGRSTRVHRVK